MVVVGFNALVGALIHNAVAAGFVELVEELMNTSEAGEMLELENSENLTPLGVFDLHYLEEGGPGFALPALGLTL